MGGCFNEFVPAAILYQNPGLYLDELVEALNQINLYFGKKPVNQNLDELGGWKIFVNSIKYHQGIFGTIDSLGLLHSKFSKITIGEKGSLSGLEIIPRHERKFWKTPTYRKTTLLEEKLSLNKKNLEIPVLEKTKVGDRMQLFKSLKRKFLLEGNKKLMDFPNFSSEKRIYKVMRVNSTKKVDPKTRGFSGGEEMIVQNLDLREIIPLYKIETFSNLTSLLKKYPEYNPENFYDKNKDNGYFSTGTNGVILNEGYSKWYKKNKKYYLDEEYLLKNNMEHTYTSIVLTSEAISKNFWEVLNYNSGDEYPEVHSRFFLENKDSFAIYLDSIKNWYFSRLALTKDMTNSELMRQRITNPIKVNLEKEYEIIKKIYPAQKRTAERRIEYEMRNRRKETPGLPF